MYINPINPNDDSKVEPELADDLNRRAKEALDKHGLHIPEKRAEEIIGLHYTLDFIAELLKDIAMLENGGTVIVKCEDDTLFIQK